MPSSDEIIVLGEFWVDADGEIFIDPDDPVKALEDTDRLQKAKDQQAPPITPSLIDIGLDKPKVRAKGINHPKHAVEPACACFKRKSATS